MSEQQKEKLSIEEIKFYSKKSMAPWLYDALVDWGIISLAIALFYNYPHIITFIFSVLIVGNRQHALTVLGHEASHFCLSENKNTNDFLSNIFAFWPLGITTSGYRNVHISHHNHMNTESDPELAHRSARKPQYDLPIKLPKVLYYAFSDLFGFSIKDYLIIVTFSKPSTRREYIPLIMVHIAFILVSIISNYWWIPAIWYVSLITSFMMFFRLRTFFEHLGTEDTHRIHLSWIAKHILAPHNIWYHWEHHKYPTIPYYNLPKIRRILNKVPVLSLKNLIIFYEHSKEIESGQVLKLKN